MNAWQRLMVKAALVLIRLAGFRYANIVIAKPIIRAQQERPSWHTLLDEMGTGDPEYPRGWPPPTWMN